MLRRGKGGGGGGGWILTPQIDPVDSPSYMQWSFIQNHLDFFPYNVSTF